MEGDSNDCMEFRNDSELAALVKRFEACEFNPGEFTHQHHLVTALWYLKSLPESDAIDQMRNRLHIFTAHHNVGAYHETITIFWMKLVSSFLSAANPSEPLYEIANRLIGSVSSSKVVNEHYSKQVLDSDEARMSWVEPDLRPVPTFG